MDSELRTLVFLAYEQERVKYSNLYFDHTVNCIKKGRGRPKSTVEKRTRKPTEYNLFVKQKMEEFKIQHQDKNNKELLQLCAQAWQSRK